MNKNTFRFTERNLQITRLDIRINHSENSNNLAKFYQSFFHDQRKYESKKK